MPDFKKMIEGMKAKEEPQTQEPMKSQRDLDTEEHNKRIAQINAKAPGMKHEDYKAEIAKEVARFNDVQNKWEDETDQNQPKADKKSLFDEYQLATPEGRKASSDFLKEMGVQNVHALTNEQYNDLARKAMERFGIDDFKLAQEFIQSNDESDRAWDEMAKARQPKNTIKLNLFGNKPKTQWKFANKAVDEPENPTKETNVREWVRKNYPTEFQTDDIRGDLTFDDLYKAMQSGEANDFYKYASEGGRGFDSAVREEIFNGLAQHYGKPYDHFYNLWLNGPEQNK